MSKTARTLTDIADLDEILNGGISQGRVVLAVGGPETGKTVFATRFLANGISKYSENSVFVFARLLSKCLHHKNCKFCG